MILVRGESGHVVLYELFLRDRSSIFSRELGFSLDSIGVHFFLICSRGSLLNFDVIVYALLVRLIFAFC